MFDFMNFIELMNDENDNSNLKKALNSIRDVFHIGKIDAKSSNFSDCIEFGIFNDYDDKVFLTYSNSGYDYNFYRSNDKYNYSNEEINDIKMLLRLVSLYHKNFILSSKIEEAKCLSLNTKLPNTHGYMKKINELSRRVDTTKYNSYFINIKGFGLINKLFGSKCGDEAIVKYAEKLKEFINLSDEVLGHLGGDNFVAFLKRERHQEFINLVTMCPIDLKHDGIITRINLIGVVGYYELQDNNVQYENIMSNSSIACQYARNTKKIIVKLTPELLDMVNSVKTIERTFKNELESGNFVVYYHPKFDIKSGKIIGVEALSRWINNGKVIPPGLFIPTLEKNGEIVDLDLFVLENLCKDIHNFRNLGNNIVPASCNLSRRDFELDDLEDRVINIIKRYNVKSQDIVIEVTETTNLEENTRLAKFIETMHKNGIMTSIDDFGTGYSSLSVLRDFKVNEIKIDRSFINREALNDSDEIIIGSIIDMAKRLNINVICEGVETQFQADFLIRLGCNNAQGFLYSKPLPRLEFEDLLKKIGTIYD